MRRLPGCFWTRFVKADVMAGAASVLLSAIPPKSRMLQRWFFSLRGVVRPTGPMRWEET